MSPSTKLGRCCAGSFGSRTQWERIKFKLYFDPSATFPLCLHTLSLQIPVLLILSSSLTSGVAWDLCAWIPPAPSPLPMITPLPLKYLSICSSFQIRAIVSLHQQTIISGHTFCSINRMDSSPARQRYLKRRSIHQRLPYRVRPPPHSRLHPCPPNLQRPRPQIPHVK